jgi:hypothetical protein
MVKFVLAAITVALTALLSAIAAYDLFDAWLKRLKARGPVGEFLNNLILSPSLRVFLLFVAAILIAWGIRENRRLRRHIGPEKLAELEGKQWHQTAQYDLAHPPTPRPDLVARRLSPSVTEYYPADAIPQPPSKRLRRRLSKDQCAYLQKTLGINNKGHAIVRGIHDDDESLDFARQLAEILRRSGWEVEWKTERVRHPEWSELMIGVRNPRDLSGANSTLVDALSGFDLVSGVVETHGEADTVDLMIGSIKSDSAE